MLQARDVFVSADHAAYDSLNSFIFSVPLKVNNFVLFYLLFLMKFQILLPFYCIFIVFLSFPWKKHLPLIDKRKHVHIIDTKYIKFSKEYWCYFCFYMSQFWNFVSFWANNATMHVSFPVSLSLSYTLISFFVRKVCSYY